MKLSTEPLKEPFPRLSNRPSIWERSLLCKPAHCRNSQCQSMGGWKANQFVSESNQVTYGMLHPRRPAAPCALGQQLFGLNQKHALHNPPSFWIGPYCWTYSAAESQWRWTTGLDWLWGFCMRRGERLQLEHHNLISSGNMRGRIWLNHLDIRAGISHCAPPQKFQVIKTSPGRHRSLTFIHIGFGTCLWLWSHSDPYRPQWPRAESLKRVSHTVFSMCV